MTKTLTQAMLITLITAVVLTGVHHLTAPTIEQARKRQQNAELADAVPPAKIDGAIHASNETLTIDALDTEAALYWGVRDGALSVVLMDFVTPNGYSGDIRLLVAVNPSGQVLGVRVLAHRETPGLGDGIEIERSDWIRQFEGTSLDSPPSEAWAADRRGGAFDTLSSATITSQAVIEAVQSALAAYQRRSKPAWLDAIQQNKTP
jgi:electron transport complex protein RnfG